MLGNDQKSRGGAVSKMPENAQKQDGGQDARKHIQSRGGVVSKMLENIENQEGRKYRISRGGAVSKMPENHKGSR